MINMELESWLGMECQWNELSFVRLLLQWMTCLDAHVRDVQDESEGGLFRQQTTFNVQVFKQSAKNKNKK